MRQHQHNNYGLIIQIGFISTTALLICITFLTFSLNNVAADTLSIYTNTNHNNQHHNQLNRLLVREKRSILQQLAVDRMLRDRPFVISAINCVLDKSPCDKHGRHLKRLVPEVLRGHCPGCDRNVQKQVRRVISHVQRNFPQQWSEVVNRFLHSVQNTQSYQNVFGG